MVSFCLVNSRKDQARVQFPPVHSLFDDHEHVVLLKRPSGRLSDDDVILARCDGNVGRPMRRGIAITGPPECGLEFAPLANDSRRPCRQILPCELVLADVGRRDEAIVVRA
jgi:hypothetical protein